jgi:PLP dependent protein
MYINKQNYESIKAECLAKNVTLIAVSKTKPIEALQELYEMGHRDFGENYVQELVDKYEALPKDIRWHFIGHLQSNKVKYIAPFVHCIHSIDSKKLLLEINKQGLKNKKVVNVLLQMYIASEETKFGMDATEINNILMQKQQYANTNINGLMGMASFSSDSAKIAAEFATIQQYFEQNKHLFNDGTLSIGMSGDYGIAISNGSTAIRVGSLIFGNRNYKNEH